MNKKKDKATYNYFFHCIFFTFPLSPNRIANGLHTYSLKIYSACVPNKRIQSIKHTPFKVPFA
ncbi:hypothetical protein D6B99_11415 [Arachidicoccus soli]|uniref:Uncharacterized protein n=1 Tax=Arachidicoccus soli TaxID=2341117 RepID=A0A386HRT7_9BACT|nr:hypothetical protein D6B99_11415 [Arachidicoccus soli]